jgi:hypothetical protein
MDSNGVLLQLIECIERMKSDVKKKMMCTSAVTHARRSLGEAVAQFFSVRAQKVLSSAKKMIRCSDRVEP